MGVNAIGSEIQSGGAKPKNGKSGGDGAAAKGGGGGATVPPAKLDPNPYDAPPSLPKPGEPGSTAFAKPQLAGEPPPCANNTPKKDQITVLLVSRSIGAPAGQPDRPDQHAALVFQLDNGEEWIVQARPENGALIGEANKVTSTNGWSDEFSKAKGGNWGVQGEAGVRETKTHTLGKFEINSVSGKSLQQTANGLNKAFAGKPYNYTSGPNSNTYTKEFMRVLGLPTARPETSMPIRGW